MGIGECGLDYFHLESEEIAGKIEKQIEKQKEVFIKHIELANNLNKPLMLHIRNGKKNDSSHNSVYEIAVNILKKYAKVRANFHFFAGSISDLKKIIEINATVSFTGALTFTHDYDDLVKSAPISSIMSETDAPYVSPIPYRGKRNEPLFVKEVVKVIAYIKGESMAEIGSQIIDNAREMFRI